jgi:protein tyrosine/serine phosphatase
VPFKNSIATFALAVSLGLTAAAPAGAKTPPPAAAQAIALPAIGIDNFGQVNAHYYRGAQPQGQDFAALARLGVKMVIDLASEGDMNERANAEREGMQFMRIPMTTSDRPSQEVIEKFLGLVNDPANQPVYVHCMGGRHRTGAMTAVYRMTQDGWNADRAFSEMKQYKFGADFLHPVLKSFVFDFFSQLGNAKMAPKQMPTSASAG